MDTFTKCMLLGVCIAIRLDLSSSQTCTREERQQCTKQLDSFFVDKHSVYPNFDDTTFTQVCNAADKADSCLRRLEPWCPDIVHRHHEGQHEAYGYICGQGSTVYKEIRECLAKSELLNDAAKCNNTYQRDLKELTAKAVHMEKKDMGEEQCSLANTYLWCVRGEVKDHCGGVAAQWHHKINRLVLTPVLDDINCVIEQPALLNRIQILIIVISVAVGIVFIIMLILTIIYCIQRKRAKNALLAHESQQENEEEAKKEPIDFTNPTIQNDERPGAANRGKPQKQVLSQVPPPNAARGQNHQNPSRQNPSPEHQTGKRHQGKKPKKDRRNKHKDHSGTPPYYQSHSQGPAGYPAGPQGHQRGYPTGPQGHSSAPQGYQGYQRGYPSGSQGQQPGYPVGPPQGHQAPYLSVPDYSRSTQYSMDGSLKSSLRSTERSNRSALSVTLDESANRNLPEYEIVPHKY